MDDSSKLKVPSMNSAVFLDGKTQSTQSRPYGMQRSRSPWTHIYLTISKMPGNTVGHFAPPCCLACHCSSERCMTTTLKKDTGRLKSRR